MADQHTTALARIAHHNAQRAERAEARHARHEQSVARVTKKIVRSGEVFAGAAVAGVVQGRFGDTKVGGLVPLDLLIGFGLNGVALSGVAKEYSDDLGNFGDGFIAGYGAEAGFAVGQRWKNTGHLFAKGVPGPAPLPPPPPGPAPQPAVHGELDPRIVAAQIIHGG
jgi:hypothetical protein